MKQKILLIGIILLMILLSNIVLAKEFGNWDKWEETLPPWDNQGWIYSEERFIVSIPPVSGMQFWFWTPKEQEKWQSIKVTESSSLMGKAYFVITRLAFKDNNQKAAAIVFSPVSENKEIKGIENALATAEIVVVAFPPDKAGKKIVIRSYERNNESFQFFKKETIAFKDRTVIPEDLFLDQFKKITKEEEDIVPQLLLVVSSNSKKEKEFFIGVSLPLFKDFLIKEGLPWIKKETIVIF